MKDREMRTTTRVLCILLLVSLYLLHRNYDYCINVGDSMQPTIRTGSFVFFKKQQYAEAGKMYVFHDPEGVGVIKRCHSVNAYGQCIMLGDNPAASYDSRSYGPISEERILGEVVAYHR